MDAYQTLLLQEIDSTRYSHTQFVWGHIGRASSTDRRVLLPHSLHQTESTNRDSPYGLTIPYLN